jgi:hypothetical protein
MDGMDGSDPPPCPIYEGSETPQPPGYPVHGRADELATLDLAVSHLSVCRLLSIW